MLPRSVRSVVGRGRLWPSGEFNGETHGPRRATSNRRPRPGRTGRTLAAVVLVAATAADGEAGALDVGHWAATADAELDGERGRGHTRIEPWRGDRVNQTLNRLTALAFVRRFETRAEARSSRYRVAHPASLSNEGPRCHNRGPSLIARRYWRREWRYWNRKDGAPLPCTVTVPGGN